MHKPQSTPEATSPHWRRAGIARRIYVAFLIAAVVPTAIAGLIGIGVSLSTLRAQTVAHLQQEVAARVAGVQLFFDQVAAELHYLAGMSSVEEMFDALDGGDPKQVAGRADAIGRNFVRLAELHPHIYQMRVLDAAGRERVRVEKRGDRMAAVPAEQLQDKSDRYYVVDALQRGPRELYVSPLDLNEEFGRVETPERPVVRVAAQVIGQGGRVRGLVVVNLHAQVLLDPLSEMVREREGAAYLFDRSGHYLVRSSSPPAGSVMQPVDALTAQLGIGVVDKLLSRTGGTVETADSIVAHVPIAFGAAYASDDQARWVMALSFPQRQLWQSVINLYLLYGVLAAALMVTAVGGYSLSRRLLQPLEDLRREADEIAAGNFTRHVRVTGHDEIADLGQRFNLMADRLSASYRQLEDHRARLKTDVADRTRELAAERARLASVFRQAGDPILAVDAQGAVTLANAAARELLGAQDAAALALSERWPNLLEVVQAVEPGQTRRSDVALGERLFAVSVDASIGDGEPRSHVIVARDVSEERRIQDERRQLDRQMFQIEKMATMGELAMGVAHEIGNPLAGMKAVVQSLQYETNLPEATRDPLQRLESEIDRLGGFLRSFHGFAAPVALDLRAVALRDALADVLFWTGKEARQQSVQVRVDLSDDLPFLRADLPQLKQVLLNLVVNALHAMPSGGELGITARNDPEGVRIELQDSGHGIAADVLPRIFDPFFTTRQSGSGLGLAITVKIVREHGARIEVESIAGSGARFVLVWPTA